MRRKEDRIFYFINLIILLLLSLISFNGVVIASLAYLLTCEIIRNS